MIDNYEADKLNEALEGFMRETDNDRVGVVGQVLGTDGDGVTWVHLVGGTERTPLSSTTVELSEGDIVEVTVGGGRAEVKGNLSSPSASQKSVGNVARIAKETAGKINAATEAAEAAKQAAAEAAAAIGSTNEHFWHNENGAHVTDDTKEAFLEAEANDFADWQPDPEAENYKPWFNVVLNSLGQVFRTGKKYLASFTHSAVAFFDGEWDGKTGDGTSSITAFFGALGARIGNYAKESFLDLTNSSISLFSFMNIGDSTVMHPFFEDFSQTTVDAHEGSVVSAPGGWIIPLLSKDGKVSFTVTAKGKPDSTSGTLLVETGADVERYNPDALTPRETIVPVAEDMGAACIVDVEGGTGMQSAAAYLPFEKNTSWKGDTPFLRVKFSADLSYLKDDNPESNLEGVGMWCLRLSARPGKVRESWESYTENKGFRKVFYVDRDKLQLGNDEAGHVIVTKNGLAAWLDVFWDRINMASQDHDLRQVFEVQAKDQKAYMTLGTRKGTYGHQSLAIGDSNEVSGTNSLAIGLGNVVANSDSLAIGRGHAVTNAAPGSLVLGEGSLPNNSTALTVGYGDTETIEIAGEPPTAVTNTARNTAELRFDGRLQHNHFSDLNNTPVLSASVQGAIDKTKRWSGNIIRVCNDDYIDDSGKDQSGAYGCNLIIGGDGNTIIGAGESADAIYSHLRIKTAESFNGVNVHSGGEDLFLGSDNSVVIIPDARYSGSPTEITSSNSFYFKDGYLDICGMPRQWGYGTGTALSAGGVRFRSNLQGVFARGGGVIGFLRSRFETDGRLGVELGVGPNTAASNAYHTIKLLFDTSGKRQVVVSESLPWRNALGASNGVWTAAMIPTLSITDKTSGTLTVARGGTGATTGHGALANMGVKRGVVTITTTSAYHIDSVVTFSGTKFTAVPNVQLTLQYSWSTSNAANAEQGAGLTPVVHAVSATSLTIRLWNHKLAKDQKVSVQWLAIGNV